jgi:hypothetical protein
VYPLAIRIEYIYILQIKNLRYIDPSEHAGNGLCWNEGSQIYGLAATIAIAATTAGGPIHYTYQACLMGLIQLARIGFKIESKWEMDQFYWFMSSSSIYPSAGLPKKSPA